MCLSRSLIFESAPRGATISPGALSFCVGWYSQRRVWRRRDRMGRCFARSQLSLEALVYLAIPTKASGNVEDGGIAFVAFKL
jgi:hypothetical protein